MIAIFKKELWNFFGNWSAWIIIAAFSIISALFLFFFENNFNIFEIGSATLQSFFVLSPWLFMFIIPAISMRTLAEEEQSGTLFWLFSQPVKITEIVGGKFLSVWLVGILCLLPSLVYYYTILYRKVKGYLAKITKKRCPQRSNALIYYLLRSKERTFSRSGSTAGGLTDSSSTPMRRKVSVKVRSAPSSPQIPTQMPALWPFSMVI